MAAKMPQPSMTGLAGPPAGNGRGRGKGSPCRGRSRIGEYRINKKKVRKLYEVLSVMKNLDENLTM